MYILQLLIFHIPYYIDLPPVILLLLYILKYIACQGFKAPKCALTRTMRGLQHVL